MNTGKFSNRELHDTTIIVLFTDTWLFMAVAWKIEVNPGLAHLHTLFWWEKPTLVCIWVTLIEICRTMAAFRKIEHPYEASCYPARCCGTKVRIRLMVPLIMITNVLDKSEHAMRTLTSRKRLGNGYSGGRQTVRTAFDSSYRRPWIENSKKVWRWKFSLSVGVIQRSVSNGRLHSMIIRIVTILQESHHRCRSQPVWAAYEDVLEWIPVLVFGTDTYHSDIFCTLLPVAWYTAPLNSIKSVFRRFYLAFMQCQR